MATEVLRSRRRIIRRPRLTKLLDENPARIKLLVAPAGYGKTTLAQEWLSQSGRTGLWYRGGPAAADVAALAAGVAVAASAVVPDAGKRMRDRLRTTGNAEEDVEVLADLLTEDLAAWPKGAWIVIDDYQYAIESAASERFVDLLSRNAPIALLLTTRRRPAWASARRILYGEIQEIDRRGLAMTDAETAAVVGAGNDVTALSRRAGGWPAMIGLAGATDGLDLPCGARETLERFFVEEILSALPATMVAAASRLAVAPTLTLDVARHLVGSGVTAVLEQLSALGIVSSVGDVYAVQPLLAEYLTRTTATTLGEPVDEVARTLARFYMSRQQWDDAFALAEHHALADLMPEIVANSLASLLASGRLATLAKWIDSSVSHRIEDARLDLAEAELAFRLNEHGRAYDLAAEAALRLDRTRDRVSALLRAGHAALMAGRERAALGHFNEAEAAATTVAEKREALVGQFYAMSELDDERVFEAFEAALELRDGTPEGTIRYEVMRLTNAHRRGGVADAASHATSYMHLLDRVNDPLIVTAFLHVLGHVLTLAARYDEAATRIEQLLETARRFRLENAVPHALLDRALVEIGRRSFGQARATLVELDPLIRPADPFLRAARSSVAARLLLSQQDFDDARATLARVNTEGLTPALRAELSALHAIAQWGAGESEIAAASTAAAESAASSSVEVRVFAAAARALVADDPSGRAVEDMWRSVHDTGNVDSFVCAYRAAPVLLERLVAAGVSRLELGEVLARANDRNLGIKFGLVSVPTDNLSPREREVAALLREGLSNREIAERLVISPATAKVHVRHIYEKIGARNRADAIARLM